DRDEHALVLREPGPPPDLPEDEVVGPLGELRVDRSEHRLQLGGPGALRPFASRCSLGVDRHCPSPPSDRRPTRRAAIQEYDNQELANHTSRETAWSTW